MFRMAPAPAAKALWPVVLAATAVAVSGLVGLVVLDGVPHVSDEVAYFFQARIIASGQVCLPSPEQPQLFRQQNVILDGARWCALYSLGWPAILSVGVALGIPWLVSPLLFGLSVLLIFEIGRQLFDRSTGWASALALALSPQAIVTSAGYMAHPAGLCSSLATLLALVHATRGRRGALVVAGALGGLTLLIRPATAVALLAPAVLWCLYRLRGRRLGAVSRMALGFAPFLLLHALYQWLAFGSAFTSGYELFDPTLSFNSMAGVEIPPGEILVEGLPWYLRELNRSLWGLPVPDLLLPLIGVLIPWLSSDRNRNPAWLGSCALSLLLVYSFYIFRDLVHGGPRLVFEALGPLCLLAGHALVSLGRRLGEVQFLGGPTARVLRVVLVFGLLVFPLGVRLPGVLFYQSGWYHGQSAELLEEVERAGVGERALILYSGPDSAFGNLMLENALDPFAGDRVFVRDEPLQRDAVLARAEGRELWVMKLRLSPLPGINAYIDRWTLAELSLHRLVPGAQ